MKENEVVEILLAKEREINGKIHNGISEILRLGYESDRGKKEIKQLIDGIRYSADEMERIIKSR